MTVENIQSGYGNATLGYARKTISTEEKYRELFEQKLSKTDEIIRNGSTEKAIQLGGTIHPNPPLIRRAYGKVLPCIAAQSYILLAYNPQ